ncbi:peptidoglycan editing factor PgeF [Wenzhouxiangella limi]|uniref:Purine nucleoside phosphorylase n=1 Tax=Wenzhouxiangella limi TaxID=2707351 RepID=A0A845UYH4_9GAMM|nr:peptidoglycan editing factor PgeF [Wenzhouxiangella limi]NDY94920.1 peptidoglycan editing factor PgeF [Wenzhouxiangella limi]
MNPIRPDWSLAGIQAFSTTRTGGVSTGAWSSLNLGGHCGDDPAAVAENRKRLEQQLPGPARWLKQVHGTGVIPVDDWHPGIEADAAWTDRRRAVLAIQAADCLPLLLADAESGVVAAAHAGWRGLAADIPGAVVQALPVSPGRLTAWIGPGISAPQYAVGEAVRSAFEALELDLSTSFFADAQGTWRCDLKDIARQLLVRAGVGTVLDSGLCTAADPERFFSYRRDGQCGRMATLIWME